MTEIHSSPADKEWASRSVAWYHADVQSNIRIEMEDLLLNYSKIPAENLVAHIAKVVRLSHLSTKKVAQVPLFAK